MQIAFSTMISTSVIFGWTPAYDLHGIGTWWTTGTWKPDPEHFPKGLRPISDAMHARDVKAMVWFEPEDRQGARENHYCIGYLKMRDDMLAANPGIIIDSCASGGRRNDLETLRRGLPLHKADYDYTDLTSKQGMNHTLCPSLAP